MSAAPAYALEPPRMGEAGDMIRRARERLGMSQEEVAAELDVKQRTVSYWETGNPPKRRLEPLADLLNLPFDELMEAWKRERGGQRQGEFVESQMDKIRWIDAVMDSDMDSDLAVALVGIARLTDPSRDFLASVSHHDVAAKSAGLTASKVAAIWPQILRSPFIERIGTGEWVFLLRFPGSE